MSVLTANVNASTIAELSAKHCIFACGQNQFALSATAVREVTRLPALVRVPRCPPALAGICHLRSEFLPVVFLAPVLGDHESALPQSNQLLVLSNPLGPWGLMIDRVISIDSIETHVDAGHREGQRSPVQGTASYRGKVVRVLDPKILHRIAQDTLHHEWNSLTNTRSNQLDLETLA